MNAPAASPAAIEAAPVTSGPVTSFAKLVGVLVLALGVLGLIPGIVTDYDLMGFYHSQAELFGLFRTSVFVGSMQILLGLTILVFSGSVRQAHKTVVWVAITYLCAGLAGAGMVVNPTRVDTVVNVASNWLHLALFVVILGGAIQARKKQIAEKGVF